MSGDVIIYARFSNDEQEAGDSLERQNRECDAFAASKGWTVIDRVVDRGRSAYKNEHLEGGNLGEFLDRLAKGGVAPGTILLAERVDRLSRREISEAMAWIHGLTRLGLRVAFADSGDVFGASPDLGTFLGTAIKFAVAHEESEKKSKRVLSAKARLWKMAEDRVGTWTNVAARPPTWLKRNATADGWILDEKRAEVVRDVYRWSADGLGAQAIARRLNEAGVEPFGVWRRYSKTWALTPIHALIKNRAVEGDFVAETGQFEGQVLHDFYPRIVDADLVARARAAKAARVKAPGEPATNGASNLWVGLAYCGECSERLAMTTNRRKGKAYRYFRCEGARQARGCKNSGYYPIDGFEDSAVKLCLDLALDDRFFESTGELQQLRIRKAEVEKAMADKSARRARLLDVFEAGDIQVRDRLQVLRTDMDALASDLQEIEGMVARASGKVTTVEHLRRVDGLREASRSEDASVRELARSRIRQLVSAVAANVSARVEHGKKVFSVAIIGADTTVTFDVDGVVQSDSSGQGNPLSWQHGVYRRELAEIAADLDGPIPWKPAAIEEWKRRNAIIGSPTS